MSKIFVEMEETTFEKMKILCKLTEKGLDKTVSRSLDRHIMDMKHYRRDLLEGIKL